jgi:MFS family permease
MTAVGTMASVQLTTSNTYLQTSAPPALRGRVVSLYVWIFQGATPLGGFAAGWMAQRAGIPAAIVAAGLVCIMSGLFLGFTRKRGLVRA